MKKRSNSFTVDYRSRQIAGKVCTTVFKSIFVILAVILIYLPIIMILLQSFNSSRNPDNFARFTLKWYQGLFNPEALNEGTKLSATDVDAAADLQVAILHTLIITILSTIISTILGVLFALGINSLSRKKRQRMILLNNVPIVNADIVTAITLMIIFSMILTPFGIKLGFLSVLVSHVFFSLPYVVLSVLPKLSEIDHNLYDAAVDLGCSPLKAIIKVIVPAIKSGILMGMVFAFTMSIDDFTISYFNGGKVYNNVSCLIYLKKSKSLSPSIYAYNTFLTFGTLIILLGYNVYIYFKKQNKKLKKVS